ncbi:hypothetical protein E8L99_13780 [Phreatobacter aquaticus]|uniref:Alpha/beta hydrolase n=1 Tax=Phreatobacter aquaticus TaxID=2570229 RepID=A0A4D7QM86_9HYPH|nr:hypothetical protein [Phreatobacter aquaticus]QCK86749.1 hypothetical protein E8L99_13780 [Phreatobacter aquaticus]
MTAALLAIVCAPATAAAQDTRPTVLLLDGLFIYVHQQYVGVSALAGMLDRLGYRTLVDTHLMTRTANAAPDVIIGHSMGGSSALKYAGEMVAAGKPAPVIITIDAAFGSPACPVPRCTNIRTPGFPDIVGAENIDAWKAGAFMVNHAMLATNPAVQQMVLRQAEAILIERMPATPPLSAPIPLPRPH